MTGRATDTPRASRPVAVALGLAILFSGSASPAPAFATTAGLLSLVAVAAGPVTMTGVVRTASGNPLPNTVVQFIPHLGAGETGVSGLATTDVDGRYSFEVTPGEGTLRLTLVHPDSPKTYNYVEATVTVDAAAPTLDVTVPDLVTVTVRVRDQFALPVGGVQLNGSWAPTEALASFEIVPGVWATGTATLSGVTNGDGQAPLVVFPVPMVSGLNVEAYGPGWGYGTGIPGFAATSSLTIEKVVNLPYQPVPAPANVRLTAGAGTLRVLWQSSTSVGIGAVTSYTATAMPGGRQCTTVPTSPTCLIDGLEPGRPYTVTVRGTNVLGLGYISAPVTGTPGVAPDAPMAIVAHTGVNQAKVSWQAPAFDGWAPIYGYTATSAPEGRSCSASGTARFCYVAGLTNGVAYTFTVTATNTAGTSVPSEVSNAVTPALDVTAPVLAYTSVTPARVSSVGGTVTVELRITDGLSGVSGLPSVHFESLWGMPIGYARSISRISGDEYDGIYRASVTLPSGTAVGTWDLLVNPISDAAGNSTFYVHAPGIVVGAPAPPTNVTATAGDGRQVTVNWDAPADNGGNIITGYEVTASPGGATYTTVAASLTTSFATWPASTPVSFTVKAVNAAGKSDASPASDPLTVPAVAPSAPSITSVSAGNQSATATWTAPLNGGSPLTGYTLTATPGGAFCQTSLLTCTITNLDNGTPYTLSVTAANSAGAGGASASGPVTPFTIPGAPHTVTASAEGASAHVQWLAPTANGGAAVTAYTVTAAPGGSTCTTSGELTCVVAGLADGPYTFTVVASNAAGDGPSSAPSGALLVDTVQPTVTMLSPVSPTPSVDLTYSLTFSESIGGLAATDFFVAGTATECLVGDPSGSGATYSVTLTGCSSGTVSLALTSGSIADSAGNAGPPGFVFAGSVLVDRAGPVAGAPSASLAVGTALVGTAVPLTLTWSGSDEIGGSGLDHYELAVSVNGGPWATLLGSISGTSVNVTAAASGKVAYAVRAIDKAGNEGGWAHGVNLAPSLVQQTSSAVKYVGAWTLYKSSATSGGNLKYSKVKNAYSTFTFTGRAIGLVSLKGLGRGSVKVYVDGKLKATVSLYKTGASQYRLVVWKYAFSTSAKHTVKLVVVGTSGRPRFDLDAFVVMK